MEEHSSPTPLVVSSFPAKIATKAKTELPLTSIVKLFVVKSECCYKNPWQKKSPKNISGSGFLLSGRRILTNAHVVEDFTTIQCRRHGTAKKFKAEVLCIGRQCDIALLTVAEDAFWTTKKSKSEDYEGLEFGGVPQLQESVTCVGYPTGGDNISVTCGVVSRVDVHSFVNTHCNLLVVQIDAAINKGNSGGPVFSETGEVVGIAFSHRTRSQNIGYIIPVPVVKHFLKEAESPARKSVFCSYPGFINQNMEAPALRKYYSMSDDHSGILIRKINQFASLAAVLKEEDILLEFDGVDIGDDGTIEYRKSERISWLHLLGMKYTGDECCMKVLRGGEKITIEDAVIRPVPRLVPRVHGHDCYPTYYIVGGLVFAPLSLPFLRAFYGSEWNKSAPSCLVYSYYYGLPEVEDEEVIVLSIVLGSEVTVGYRAGRWLSKVQEYNDQKIHNMLHLIELVKQNKDPFHCFKLGEKSSAQRIVLDTEGVDKHEAAILERHSISSNMSVDLKERLAKKQEEMPKNHEEEPGSSSAKLSDATNPKTSKVQQEKTVAPE